MDQPKKWHWFCIYAVLAITLYNICPTVIWYSKPLGQQVNKAEALVIAENAIQRVNSLEQASVDWIYSFSKMIGVKPTEVKLDPTSPRSIHVNFSETKEADRFKRFVPLAGARIDFVPSKLMLAAGQGETVVITRMIGTHLDAKSVDELFTFTPKILDGEVTPFYRGLVYNRALQIAEALSAPSVTAVRSTADDERNLTLAAEDVVEMSILAKKAPASLTKRLFASLNTAELNQKLASMNGDTAQKARDALSAHTVTPAKQKSRAELDEMLKRTEGSVKSTDGIQKFSLKDANPFVEELWIDWTDDVITLKLYSDVEKMRAQKRNSEQDEIAQETLSPLVFNGIARISELSDEDISPVGTDFVVNLNTLTSSSSVLALHLGRLADKEASQMVEVIKTGWNPSVDDLKLNAFPVRTFVDAQSEAPEEKNLGIIVYAPSSHVEVPEKGFREGSIYIIAMGLDAILQNESQNQALIDDFVQLRDLLQKNGYVGYSGINISEAYKDAFVFELSNYYSAILGATRENFSVKGNKRFAVLELTNLEERLLATNRIEDAEQEELIKWTEEYSRAQVSMDPRERFSVAPPTKNPTFENLKLSLRKYFRGDDRKVLQWGLDLSGGKTVRIGLRDQNGRPVTNPDDLNQAVNELYTRVNAMGVSERTIRVENDTILLDFPGSQAFSASELVKASAMYFHVMNEKFGRDNATSQQFLQDVWNEAVVTGRKDAESINEIAWRQMGGTMRSDDMGPAKSEPAKQLRESGLVLASPYANHRSSNFNDRLSMIAVQKGDSPSEWGGQSHPLVIVFNNYALEGANLAHVQVGYSPTEGHDLRFDVKSGAPRQDLHAWTSAFNQTAIAGTAKEAYAKYGWKMAVLLNGKIVSAPSLKGALSDHGTISGQFTAHQIQQLASDLKAGSLTYTPLILSEQNVSPELGKEERSKGIFASLLSLVGVAVLMIGVYRFAGVVACAAVFFNLFIMWGVLQSIGAALTLPGIAGIVLTIGMAVDANVLVFERIREEFAISGRLTSAIAEGYKKAFTAIFDSNLTTLMAAVILLQFDSGPIKGFAIVLMIGILSSMFTALFVTRAFFTVWVKKTGTKALTMMHILSETHVHFLRHAKKVGMVSLVLAVVGSYMVIVERNTIFGMDFTGGYSLTLDLAENPETAYRIEATEAITAAGATAGEVEVRELSRPNQLRIQLGVSLEEEGHAFYGMPQETLDIHSNYSYEHNPRIVWVVNALKERGLDIQQAQLEQLDKNWSVMSGQLSDTMRNNALYAIGFALVGILGYITFRFEFKYAVGAVVALAHDVVITLGVIALFHLLGFPVQIDLQVIGALMTIIGYSLNDTIIVFDRVREDVKLLNKSSFEQVIDHALNITLSRTLMTSGTTLVVLLALVFFGGPTIFGFALVMTIGVAIGTLSSLFIASPVMLMVHKKEVRNL